RSIGLEASAAYHYRDFSADINYGRTDARFIKYDDGQNDYSGKHVPYIPLNTLAASVTYTLRLPTGVLESIDFNINTKAFGKIWWDEMNTVSQPFYALLNASVGFMFGKGFSVEIWGKNITATDYDTFYFVSMGNAFLQNGLPARYGISLRLEL
ncbi:MAG: TonB-dependent receptor, partial [Bacteroidetes bacterium]|nr:TonB-dependent receptor [Candidatus Merdivivens pullicola]